jgi:hypothetical protein
MDRPALVLILAAIGLAACKPDPVDSADDTNSGPIDTGDTVDTSSPDEPKSDFTDGTYHVTAMEILDDDQGFDLTGDGEIDNKLPAVLTLLDMAMEDDMSREGMNATIGAAIEAGDLVQLIEAHNVEVDLTYDLLVGSQDEHGALHLDEAQSYDSEGQPWSRLEGAFLDQTTIRLGPDDVQIPVTFYPEEPALMIPVAQAIAEGELTVAGTTCTLGGAIPVDELMVQVVEPLIPEEGYGDQTKEELLETIEALLSNENVAQIELADGGRGIAAALWFFGEPATW